MSYVSNLKIKVGDEMTFNDRTEKAVETGGKFIFTETQSLHELADQLRRTKQIIEEPKK